MEIWFLAALAGAILAGVSNFYFKVAAKNGYDAEVFTLIGGLVSVVAAGIVAYLVGAPIIHLHILTFVMLAAGILAATGGIMKVYALRHIDSTIYFPLFKLLAPGLAIIFGVVWFAESFTAMEWLGMALGLTVPLLLITKSENGRQNNLKAGLVFVVLTALASASAAALNKFVIDAGIPVLTGLFYASLGVFLGTIMTIVFKKGLRSTYQHITDGYSAPVFWYGSLRAILISASFGFILYAYQEGSLAIIQTIHSMYILIPIVFSVILYHEHWNTQKALAITFSVLALVLLS